MLRTAIYASCKHDILPPASNRSHKRDTMPLRWKSSRKPLNFGVDARRRSRRGAISMAAYAAASSHAHRWDSFTGYLLVEIPPFTKIATASGVSHRRAEAEASCTRDPITLMNFIGPLDTGWHPPGEPSDAKQDAIGRGQSTKSTPAIYLSVHWASWGAFRWIGQSSPSPAFFRRHYVPSRSIASKAHRCDSHYQLLRCFIWRRGRYVPVIRAPTVSHLRTCSWKKQGSSDLGYTPSSLTY
jgi:hypothetical protein